MEVALPLAGLTIRAPRTCLPASQAPFFQEGLFPTHEDDTLPAHGRAPRACARVDSLDFELLPRLCSWGTACGSARAANSGVLSPLGSFTRTRPCALWRAAHTGPRSPSVVSTSRSGQDSSPLFKFRSPLCSGRGAGPSHTLSAASLPVPLSSVLEDEVSNRDAELALTTLHHARSLLGHTAPACNGLACTSVQHAASMPPCAGTTTISQSQPADWSPIPSLAVVTAQPTSARAQGALDTPTRCRRSPFSSSAATHMATHHQPTAACSPFWRAAAHSRSDEQPTSRFHSIAAAVPVRLPVVASASASPASSPPSSELCAAAALLELSAQCSEQRSGSPSPHASGTLYRGAASSSMQGVGAAHAHYLLTSSSNPAEGQHAADDAEFLDSWDLDLGREMEDLGHDATGGEDLSLARALHMACWIQSSAGGQDAR